MKHDQKTGTSFVCDCCLRNYLRSVGLHSYLLLRLPLLLV
jgi:hypothetical protein